ncbi:unnamed protein product [Urochloa decumbens]|uniref:PUM-HD domain-containing protein n=1 Tax=Urochloa decumbens TaxID=240449 RepID=A0ABC9FKK6_9POAL
MDPCRGSSKRDFTGNDCKLKGVVHEEAAIGAAAHQDVYRLGSNFSIDLNQPPPKLKQPKLEVDTSSDILTPHHPKASTALQLQLQLPVQARRQPTYMELLLGDVECEVATFFPEGIHSSSSQVQQDNNAKEITGSLNSQGQMSIAENTLSPSGAVSGTRFSGAQRNIEKNSNEATIVQQQRASSGSSQVQHYGASGSSNMMSYVQQLQQQIATRMNTTTIRLTHIKGKVASCCADHIGSYFVRQAIETATPKETIMVYEEIIPCVRMLAVDAFGSLAIQKVLDHGPQFYKRKLIDHLIGHVLALSHHMYGCQVIQKAFEVSEQDQKVDLAKELGSKTLRCVRDQYANNVIQKCIECLPSKQVEFIFQRFCGKAKVLSTHPYGCDVIQKVLAYCKNPEIYHTVTAEIVASVNELSEDQFGHCVVEYLLRHGTPVKRSIMVNKFAGQIVNMSYHKFSSKVIAKCLTFGSHQERQLIMNEIFAAGVYRLKSMMLNPYAGLVIQKMAATAVKWQVAVLVAVARSNFAVLKSYPHGAGVLAAINRAKGRYAVPAVAVKVRPQHQQR